MKFMILVKGTANDEEKAAADFKAGTPEMKKQMAAMEGFNDELRKAGILKDCDGLQPSRMAKRVRFEGQSRTVTDGPFHSQDLVCGYWIWELPSMEEAVSWVKRCPSPMAGPSDIDIRPIEAS
ncbi:MAG: YciI family protein [Rhizobacter sp.]